MMDLDEMRKEIDDIDSQLAKLINKRMKLSKDIGEFKKEKGLAVFDAKREEELKNKNIQYVDECFKKDYLEILELILKTSKNLQL